MKKLKNQSIKLWLSLLFLVILTPIRAFSASSVGINGLYYELNSSSNTAKVVYDSSYSSLPVSVIIPESVEYNGATYSVTEIGQSAFSGCSKLESISIPGSVTKVGEVYYYSSSNNYNPNKYPSRYTSVFKGCTSLKKVRFEDGSNSVALGSTYYKGFSTAIAGVNIYGRGLFADCPLEEVD